MVGQYDVNFFIGTIKRFPNRQLRSLYKTANMQPPSAAASAVLIFNTSTANKAQKYKNKKDKINYCYFYTNKIYF